MDGLRTEVCGQRKRSNDPRNNRVTIQGHVKKQQPDELSHRDSAWRTWAAQKHSEAGYGRPVDRGVWTAKTVKRPRRQPAHPQYANYWAPLTRKRHIPPHSAQPQHTNYWAPRTRKRHQQEHRPQRPTESSDPTQHAKGRTGDRPGPRKGATTRRNATQGVVCPTAYGCNMLPPWRHSPASTGRLHMQSLSDRERWRVLSTTSDVGSVT